MFSTVRSSEIAILVPFKFLLFFNTLCFVRRCVNLQIIALGLFLSNLPRRWAISISLEVMFTLTALLTTATIFFTHSSLVSLMSVSSIPNKRTLFFRPCYSKSFIFEFCVLSHCCQPCPSPLVFSPLFLSAYRFLLLGHIYGIPFSPVILHS